MAMQISKYLLANERDALWGLTVSTVGYEEIKPGDAYPTRGHADGYYFELERGRELNEYQLLYLSEGEGVFHSATVREKIIREGDLFLLFPGEWHSYHPNAHTGWKSYWIGFKGRNMDDRGRAGFLTPQKPVYHVGFSDEIVRLYKEAYDSAVIEAAYSQQLMAGIVNHLIGIMYSLERNIQLSKNQTHVDMINRARLRLKLPQAVQGVHGAVARHLPAGLATATCQGTAVDDRPERKRNSLPTQFRVARLFLGQVQD